MLVKVAPEVAILTAKTQSASPVLLCVFDVVDPGRSKTPTFAGSKKNYLAIPLPLPWSRLADNKVLGNRGKDKVHRLYRCSSQTYAFGVTHVSMKSWHRHLSKTSPQSPKSLKRNWTMDHPEGALGPNHYTISTIFDGGYMKTLSGFMLTCFFTFL